MSDIPPSITLFTQSNVLGLPQKWQKADKLTYLNMVLLYQSEWGTNHVSQGQAHQQAPAGSKALPANSLVFSACHHLQPSVYILPCNEDLSKELWHWLQGIWLARGEGDIIFLSKENMKHSLFIIKFYELLFGHGTINMRKYPKSIKYLYVVTSVFFLFMLSFFYLVSFL